MKKMTLALLSGGVSSEREVSLNSGDQVYEALDKEKYNILRYDPKTDLIRLMETDQPFTNPELTLTQLADCLDVSPHNLSEVINTRLNQNFFDFINHYRIQKIKTDMIDPTKQHLKLLSIAFDAGFNSKSSFNAIFKKSTHMTPSEYRRQAINR